MRLTAGRLIVLCLYISWMCYQLSDIGKFTNLAMMHFLNPTLERQFLGPVSTVLGVTSSVLAVYISIDKISFLAHLPHDMMWTDWYYAELFPLTLLVTVVANYVCHLSMRLFKHAGYSPSHSQRARSYGLALERLLGILRKGLAACIFTACTCMLYMHVKLSFRNLYLHPSVDTTTGGASRCGLNLCL